MPRGTTARKAIDALVDLARRNGLLSPGAEERQPRSRVLVVYLHGFGGNIVSKIDESLIALSSRHGFDLDMPQGSGFLRSWNAIGCCGKAVTSDLDDIGRIVAVLEEARPLYERVYLVGYSNGAMLSTLVAAQRADLVDGLALVAGCLFNIPQDPSRPVPTIMINAEDDGIVPVAGGLATGFTLPALPATALADYWKRVNGTAAPVEVVRPATGGHLINPTTDVWRFLSALNP